MELSESSKPALEIQKIQLEINELNKSWWRKPSIYVSLFPSIVTLGSLIWLISSGLLDVKTEKLNIEKAKLQLEITQFQQQKMGIISQVDSLQKEMRKVNVSIKTLLLERDSLANLIIFVNTSKDKYNAKNRLLRSQNDGYTKEVEKLQFQVKELQYRYDVDIRQYSRRQREYLDEIVTWRSAYERLKASSSPPSN